MSTASGLSTEELASNLFGTKAGGGLQEAGQQMGSGTGPNC